MAQVTTIGLDIAKHVFQAHGADAAGRVLFRKRPLTRPKLIGFLTTQGALYGGHGGVRRGRATLSLVGATGAAIVLGARRGGVLLLLVLPLAIPVLIFGVAAVDAASSGESPRPHLLLLGALLAGALPLCPLAAGAALHRAME